MTKEEAEIYAQSMSFKDAIYNLMQAKSVPYRKATFIKIKELLKALEQEPTTKIEESNFSQEQYLADIQGAYDCGKSFLDKIRAEMLEEMLSHSGTGEEVIQAYADGIKKGLDILDKYKAEVRTKDE